MKARNRKSFLRLLTILMMAGMSSVALAADVDVFAEGAYTTTALEVHIFAKINADNLCSYGVTLNYDPGKLTAGTATKNDNVWYFGTTSAKQPYMNPDTSTPGKIVFIGGKLDTGSPTAGVTGTRVLLGKATFTRKDSNSPGTTPETYFGISLTLGKADPYDNFVTTVGAVKDGAGVAFNTANMVRERGDANGDKAINSTDYTGIRNLLGTPNPPPYADCNGDGLVNSTDYTCVRNKL